MLMYHILFSGQKGFRITLTMTFFRHYTAFHSPRIQLTNIKCIILPVIIFSNKIEKIEIKLDIERIKK